MKMEVRRISPSILCESKISLFSVKKYRYHPYRTDDASKEDCVMEAWIADAYSILMK